MDNDKCKDTNCHYFSKKENNNCSQYKNIKLCEDHNIPAHYIPTGNETHWHWECNNCSYTNVVQGSPVIGSNIICADCDAKYKLYEL